MNQDVLQKLKDHYTGEYAPCRHEFTHPQGCDHCGAVFCWSCSRYHQKPDGNLCPFARLLNTHSRDLIGLAYGSQRAVQEFIDAHHNPFVAYANKTMDHQHKQILLLEDGLRTARQGLWTCQECGFSFSAVHSNSDGSYSCPNCNEAELMTENCHLKEGGKAKSELIQFLNYQLGEILKREDQREDNR